MMRHRIAIAAALLAVASPASAWTPIAGSQPTWSGPVPYSLNQNGSADLGGFAATEGVVREGMDDWTTATCTGLQTAYQGSTTAQPFQSGNGVIGWYESSWPESSSAIGVTGPSWNGSNRIIDAHMMMNGVHFTWTNDAGSGNRVNAYSIVLHEGGHYYGIGHSGDRGAAMYPAYGGGRLTMSGDDTTAICTLYPGAGGGALDCTATGCPAGQSCIGGTCVADPGTVGGLCDDCTSDAQCPGLCLRYPDGQGYCGTPCTTDADCAGDTCGRTTDGRQQCVRLSGGSPDCTASPPGPGPDPDPEPDPAGCVVAADCGSGERCAGGACVPDVPGVIGDPCAANEHCDSGICAIDSGSGDSFCTRLCDPAAPCPGGFSCAEGICLPGAAGLGDACTDNAECMSGICADSATGPSFCTRTCTTADTCAGFDCVPVDDGAVSVCVPPGDPGLSPGRFSETRTLYGRSCTVAEGRGGAAPWWLALPLLAMAARRRRR